MHTKNEIIEELYKSREFNECIDRMDNKHLHNDLKGEVMLILLGKSDEVIKDLYLSNGLRYYTVRIIMNLIQSKTSPFYKVYRRPWVQMEEESQPADLAEDVHDRQRRELMQDQAAAIVEGMYWYDKTIIELYIKLGSYRKIEKETGISWESCYCTIQKAFKKIRNELKPA